MTEQVDPRAVFWPPEAGDEAATLLGSLERQRATFAWKVGGLDAAALRRTVAASSMTLGGMIKHLAFVEELAFQTSLHGRPPGPPWDTVNWDDEPDYPWASAAQDSPEALYALWRSTVVASRAAIDEALADGGLDRRMVWMSGGDERPSLRRRLADLIEEYARHTGQADIFREQIDGVVGEDPPDVPALYPVPGRAAG
jgi:hypothetical protein